MALKDGIASALCDQEIACQQVLLEDATVFSIQWSVFPGRLAAALTPEELLKRYLACIRRCTATIVRPRGMPEGIELRLLGSGPSLISFLPPVIKGKSLVLRIRGGLLVQPLQRDRGEVRFEIEKTPEGTRVALRLSGYCPLILGGPSPSIVRCWLYRLTQAAIHRLVTVRFLTLLYRELAGSVARVRLVGVRVHDGWPV